MMSPTILFNILCVVISILGSSTTAQLGNWDILFQSLETDFQDAMTNIITLKYQIGSGRKFIVELMEKNCDLAVSGDAVTTTTTIDRTAGVTSDHDNMEIKLVLEKSTIASRVIWEDNSLRFCMRVRLLSGGSIIREE
jgi:hypothetical protein